ncbi:MAG TPA: acyl-CoA dehydrogenase family protein [Acidimicrobiales bacterium]|nr:acyl-CoA dehydrogenase family protein [Acidimicrobiales bacterium]
MSAPANPPANGATPAGAHGLTAREIAAELSDSLLFPSALEVDQASAVPVSHLDALASAGLYGMAGPPDHGGLGLEPEEAMEVIERLASGCLTTTFVWLQHHAAVRAVSIAGGAVAEQWLRPLCDGERRAGVAFAGLRRPGPPLLAAEQTGESWAITGAAPWVTGWSLIDVMLVAARVPAMPGAPVLWLLVDAVEGQGLSVERLRLEAVDASVTVRAAFDGVQVSEDRVIGIEPFAHWQERDAGGLRPNGHLSLGLARRCARLLGGPAGLAIGELVVERRRHLAGGDVGQLPRARAEAAELALAAATSLVIETGGRAVLMDSMAQLLARQAIFLLVFGQTPAIKSEQLRLRARP